MKNRTDSKLYGLAASAAVAAVYAALTLVLAPISYGALQFRLSEVLCILPFFFPMSSAGLFIGCLIANLFSPVGILDIVFGPVATLLAGLCTAAIGKRAENRAPASQDGEGTLRGWGSCIAACAMPVVFNALIIGAILAWTLSEESFLQGLVLFGAEVGLGEAAVLFVVGLPVMRILLKNKKIMEFFGRLR